ncbi:MAG: hypothetical protein IPH26_09000 [Sterolibacteriaceae bacterium]|uniref:Uncharacterized protein n=1 Tax=Candidatus Methylophosphatis roskildensis TaxID=2899263 RepID=A0A9D7DY92_9PROT|nr:hypothetical protein [Candidatus Methylophosphatis roskildensis]
MTFGRGAATLSGAAERANTGASAASICPHGIRFASTASGRRRSIIWSSRARKKSSVAINLPRDFPQVLVPSILISGSSKTLKFRQIPLFIRVSGFCRVDSIATKRLLAAMLWYPAGHELEPVVEGSIFEGLQRPIM